MKQNPQATFGRVAPQVKQRTIEGDHKDLQHLRQSCRVTLERYVDVASLLSSHLSRLSPLSLDDLGRANLAVLKQKEDRSHQVYLNARDALLKHVLGRSERSDQI
jgi:hypothetical protein